MKNLNFKNSDEILDFAMNNEQEAHDFYINLSKIAKNDSIKKSFIQFAEEEKQHKNLLQKIKEGGLIEIKDEKVQNLRISDFVVRANKPKEEISYEDALILAMKREKAAYRLYSFLSEKTENEKMKKVFASLAQEEAKHKLKFEVEYDELVYREN